MEWETRRKVIISGRLIEYIKYQVYDGPRYKSIDQFHNFASNNPSCVSSDAIENQEESKASSLRRARRSLARLIYANYGFHSAERCKYLVLTKRENWGLDEANIYFKKFIMRLNYGLKLNLQYVCVPEFQKRGSVHYNLVMFNFPFLMKVYSRLHDFWGADQLKMQVLRGMSSVNRVVPYISKYISKQFDDPRFFGRKRYYASRGLRKPIQVITDSQIQCGMPYLDGYQVYDSVFDSPYCGEIQYRKYILPADLSVYNFVAEKFSAGV